MLPVRRHQPAGIGRGKAVVNEQDNAPVLRCADDPPGSLQDLVHAGIAVGVVKASAAGLFKIVPQLLLPGADLRQTGADDSRADQALPCQVHALAEYAAQHHTGMLFRQQQPRRGRDVEAELPLTLEEVARGGRRSVSLQTAFGPKTLEVNVPSGIREGAKLRLGGQGEPAPGGAPGDLFLRVRYLPHAVFKVDGDNLQCDVVLAPWEAALGARVPVPTLEGQVEMNIPAGSSSGRKFRLRGKGLGSAQHRGDLLARVMIRVPEQLSDEEKALWQQLADKSSFRARG